MSKNLTNKKFLDTIWYIKIFYIKTNTIMVETMNESYSNLFEETQRLVESLPALEFNLSNWVTAAREAAKLQDDDILKNPEKLTKLTVKDAKLLWEHYKKNREHKINLSWLKEISREATEALLNDLILPLPDINLSWLTSLTDPKVAELLSWWCNSINLSWLKEISWDVANGLKTVNRARRGNLDLSWLTQINENVAKNLGNWRFDTLNLSWLTNISDPKIAEWLVWWNHIERLNLSWIKSLTKEVAEKLSNFPHWYLDLSWVTFISKDVAEKFANNKDVFNFLDLSWLKQIPKDVATYLSKIPNMNLSWISYIDSDVLEKLLKNVDDGHWYPDVDSGSNRNLSWLENIDYKTAKVLVKKIASKHMVTTLFCQI